MQDAASDHNMQTSYTTTVFSSHFRACQERNLKHLLAKKIGTSLFQPQVCVSSLSSCKSFLQSGSKMPVNTTSTGATYGKSSDPLCPLGFHPQVRWPTRCKRCFRDYKEHTDDNDKAKFSNLSRGASVEDDDPWSNRRSGFQRSKSLDVSMMDTLSKYGGGSSRYE